MIGRLLGQSLGQVRRSTLVLSLGAGAFFYLVLFSSSAFLPEVGELPGAAGGFLRNPPRAFEAFLGGSANFFDPSGWLAAGMTHPVSLALLTGAALAVSSGAVAAEVERGTVDLVLSRPVGRVRFLLGKAAASLVAVSLVEVGAVAGALVGWATVDRVDELSLRQVLEPFGVSWMLFAALAMVGVLVSARSSLRSRAVGLSVGLVVAWFFANFIALLIDEVSWLRYASPFHYFRPGDVIESGAGAIDVAVLAGLGVGALSAAALVFSRRDLTR